MDVGRARPGIRVQIEWETVRVPLIFDGLPRFPLVPHISRSELSRAVVGQHQLAVVGKMQRVNSPLNDKCHVVA